jgi:Phytanoyl-CoA dioxygenase (PhyH).
MFEPNDVATVWIALDDMLPELGPITYVKSSHRWGDGRIGSTQNFFQNDGGKSLLYSAASREGIENVEKCLEFESMAGMQAGGISIHGEWK